ncbi:uncharacterized protein LOC122862178 [Xyrichtys novacula]|uniref:Uncharacterized protein LOC122862178 n=1 Tax=Xyrichtys novacula TaxID=13765 RepID=A0AAV1GMG5_XYRNO|nr:uncharacterized protein LOC122862178 [Xyrichtys novacula]
MIRLFILLQALALSSSELSKNKVDQTPTALIKHPGETVLLSCNHSNPSFDMIQWYKQSAEGQDLVLLAFVRFSYRDVEDQFKDLYNVSGTVMHSAAETLNLEQKPAPLQTDRQTDRRDHTMTITAGLIYVSAALLSITGVIHGGDVDQDLQIWRKEGQNATMACSHKKDATYFQMYWFRQLPGKRMEQIVLTTTSPPYDYFPGFSSSVSVKVTQTPADLFYTPGDTARINCSHDESRYDQILWYKKTNGTQMQLLGFMSFTTGYPEDKVNVTFEGGASKDQNCTLIIEKVDLSSSAVYFCAASVHSALHHCSSVQKPPLHYSPQTPAPGSLPFKELS